MKKDLENGNSNEKVQRARLLFSCRLSLCIICLFATFHFLLQRMNISFALVCMVKRNVSVSDLTFSELVINETKVSGSDTAFGISFDNEEEVECKRLQASKSTNISSANLADEGEFEWTKEEQGVVLGSFFYGFIFTQILGGWLADRFGGRLALLFTLASLSLLTLLNPIAAEHGPGFLFGVRLLMGLTHGSGMSAINVLATRWCAPTERGFLMGIAFGGFSLAATVTFPLSGFICSQFGWRWIFYVTGLSGVIMTIVAFFTVYDWPEDHPRISSTELHYLQKTRSVGRNSGSQKQKLIVPWMKLASSIPLNVIHITHFCGVWGFTVIGMYLPAFLKEVLHMDTSKNGIYSSLPFFGMLFMHFTVGSVFDFFRRKDCCTITNLRKIFNTVGMLGSSVSMSIMGFLTCTYSIAGIVAVTISQSFAELCFMGGYFLSIFEICPQYAGIVSGITNTFGVLPGFLAPAFVAYMTQDGTREQWLVVFLSAAGINLLGCLVYILFGSSEMAPWAVPTSPSPVKETEMKDLQEKLLGNSLFKNAESRNNHKSDGDNETKS